MELRKVENAGHQALTERPTSPKVSLLVPVYNEESTVDLFVSTVSECLARQGLAFEILFIDDGSRDGTLERLRELSTTHPNIRIVQFARNFSKEAALTAGIDYARGDVVIPIDVDLQDPPELIGRFIELWREGYDVVYGLRQSRGGDGMSKRLTAALFYRLFNVLSPVKIPENVGDFRLMDRRVVDVLRMLPERNRFMKGLFAWVGFRSIGVPYERPARQAGISKWGYWRLWNFALDGVIGFSTMPLRIWTYVGLVTAGSAFLYAFFIIVFVAVRGIAVPGYASLLTVVLFIGGIQLLSLGIIGEYLGRLFIEVKRRPVYVVQGVYENGEVKKEPAPTWT
jgi:glycosyltransferase involved in cell wall biosynthesis